MKKQLIMLGIAVLLICVGLTGCFEDKKESDDSDKQEDINKLIGKWRNLESNSTENLMTFYDNGTFKIVANYLDEGYNNTAWGYFDIKDGRLCMSESLGQYESTECLDYDFSNNNTTLSLIYWYLEGNTVLFNKI